MDILKGFQKRYLRARAHSLKPVVFVGQKGFSQTLADALDSALEHHELVKIKFIEFKEKAEKLAIVERIEKETGCQTVGSLGHMVVVYRQQKDPQKRKINLPTRPDAQG